MANATEIKVDKIEDCEAEYNLNGWSVTRKYIVIGVTGSTGWDKLSNAVNGDDGIITVPSIGDPIAEGSLIVLQSIKPKALTTDTFELTLNYASYPLNSSGKHIDEVPFQTVRTSARISASVGQEDTTMDKDGNPITVTYTYPSDYKYNNDKIDAEESQVGRVPKFDPQMVVTLSKRLTTTAAALEAEWRSYGGTVNASTWRNGAARTWLFSGIDATPNEDNTTWDVQYQFQYRSDTWDSTVVFIDPNTGHTPPDIDDYPNATKTVQVLNSTNFSGISIA